ncbi:hypothetical protein [Amycolatopsis sp. NPDC051903]|uniref:hypothetical protein n=1 Tax=Amycolatopsis sp. NPDC051903 TaxID=3363936 RepID=UPI0037AC7750
MSHLHYLVDTFLAIDPPDSDPITPKGKFGEVGTFLIGVLKWGGLVVAVAAMVVAGIMMAGGRRHSNRIAVDGAMSVPWIVVGVALIMGASSLVGWVIS